MILACRLLGHLRHYAQEVASPVGLFAALSGTLYRPPSASDEKGVSAPGRRA